MLCYPARSHTGEFGVVRLLPACERSTRSRRLSARSAPALLAGLALARRAPSDDWPGASTSCALGELARCLVLSREGGAELKQLEPGGLAASRWFTDTFCKGLHTSFAPAARVHSLYRIDVYIFIRLCCIGVQVRVRMWWCALVSLCARCAIGNTRESSYQTRERCNTALRGHLFCSQTQ